MFSDLFDDEMIQFDPEYRPERRKQNKKKKSAINQKRPAGGDAREDKYSLFHSITCILIKNQQCILGTEG